MATNLRICAIFIAICVLLPFAIGDDEQIQTRKKRSYSEPLVGGPMILKADDVKPLLKSSLQKLRTGDSKPYKIGKIFSATRQIVSGTLTTIDAELIREEDNQSDRCEIKIWSQPWSSNNDDVQINCSNENKQQSVEEKNLKAEKLFVKFQKKYNKQYGSTLEYQMRLRVFKDNLIKMKALNDGEQGSAVYGINHFADMTTEEFKAYTGLLPHERENVEAIKVPEIELPKEFDWRTYNIITEVKNQGSCGSCWAFSVTGNIEGLHAIKTGIVKEFSEQELLDCDVIDSACNGGLPDNAYKALSQIGGLEYESDYPYAGRKQKCGFNSTKSHAKITGGIDLPKNETAMAQWLITNGPISIGINANAMQFYRGGVSHPWHALCSKGNLDHGVLIVGYGVSEYPSFHKTLPYWIIKNSWGNRWGEQGYYRVYRGDNTCGVSEMASSAVLA